MSQALMLRLRTLARPQVAAASTWLALLLPIFAWAPLTYPGFFEFQSGYASVFNLTSLAALPGDWGWAPAVAQPYDLWRGEGRLAYALALSPHWLGLAAPDALKLVFAAAIIAGALGTFVWARRRLGEWPALIAAIAYALWPVGLATIYQRGALAEAVLLGLMPWIWWAADGALEQRPRAALLAGGLALALWTQAGLALWLLALVLLYLLVSGRWRAGLAAWVTGLAVGLGGLAPAWLTRGLGTGAWPAFGEHFIYPNQLLQAGWGSAPGSGGPDGALSFDLGLVAIALAVVGLILAPRSALPAGDGDGYGPPEPPPQVARFAVLVPLLAALLSTALAAPLWAALPPLARTLTYPWQLLLLGGPWLAWLAALGVRRLLDQLEPGVALPVVGAALALIVLGSYGLLDPPSSAGPVPDTPLAVFEQGEIVLLDADLFGLPMPGGEISATVRWQALRPPAHDYTVFFQAVDAEGRVYAQLDTMPQAGELPTTQWRPGQVVVDQYRLVFEGAAPGDDYRYLLGLYQWQTGVRLRTVDDDKVVLKP